MKCASSYPKDEGGLDPRSGTGSCQLQVIGGYIYGYWGGGGKGRQSEKENGMREYLKDVASYDDRCLMPETNRYHTPVTEFPASRHHHEHLRSRQRMRGGLWRHLCRICSRRPRGLFQLPWENQPCLKLPLLECSSIVCHSAIPHHSQTFHTALVLSPPVREASARRDCCRCLGCLQFLMQTTSRRSSTVDRSTETDGPA